MRNAMLIAIVTVALSLGGCAAMSGVESLSAKVQSVSVVEQTPEGARLRVVIEVHNPNVTPLPMPYCNCTVDVQGLGSFSFEDLPNTTAVGKRTDIVQDEGVQTFTYFAAFPTNGRDVSSLSYNVSGSVTYNPPGEVRKLLTDAYIPLPWASFSSSGKL